MDTSKNSVNWSFEFYATYFLLYRRGIIHNKDKVEA